MYSDLQYLSVALPEDIAKLKGCGYFEQARRVIDMRLKKDLPLSLRKRLELEKDVLAKIPPSYPFSYDDAARELTAAFTDFRPEELQRLWEEDAADWIFKEGKPFFKDDIVANLVKTRPELAARVKNPDLLKDKEGNFSLLDGVIAKMREKGELAYRIRIRSALRVKPEFEKIGETIRVHLPLPVEYAQVKDFTLLSTGPAPKHIGAPDYPQRTIYFEEKYERDMEFFVEYEYVNHMRYVDPKPEEALSAQPTFYTEELEPHIVFSPYMMDLTAEVIGDEENPLLRARKIYDFVTSKVMYSFVRPYFAITDIPGYCVTGFKGDCGIQALTFITMCRCAGIPARWQSGLYANPLSIGNHDWAQYYIAPYGWLFADCSFGGAAWRAGATERWNFYASNLEPFRMPACSDFQHEFYPPKAYLRDDPYDNQTGEAEYASGGLYLPQYETTLKVVEIEEIV